MSTKSKQPDELNVMNIPSEPVNLMPYVASVQDVIQNSEKQLKQRELCLGKENQIADIKKEIFDLKRKVLVNNRNIIENNEKWEDELYHVEMKYDNKEIDYKT